MSGTEFLSMVDSGEVEVGFSAASFADTDSSFNSPTSQWISLETTLSGSTFSTKVPVSYYPQGGEIIGIQLSTGGNDSHYNNNSRTYGIKDRFAIKGDFNTTSFMYTATADKVTFSSITLSKLGEYYESASSSYTTTAYSSVIRFYKDSKLLAGTTATSMSYVPAVDVPISYGTNPITVALYSRVNGEDYFQKAYDLTVKSASVEKNKVYATRISANKAIIRWSGSSGASGYYVYMGNKKVKTVGAFTNKVTIARKGAGKAKYKVIPYVESGGSTIKGTSNAMKAKANVMSRSVSTNYKNYDYGKGQVILKKISGSGKKYTITCYAINNRMFKLQKYKKIKITVYADGKKLFSKTIKNKKVNVKKYGTKKFSFKAKGKEGDLKHGSVTWSISYTPYWGKGITAF